MLLLNNDLDGSVILGTSAMVTTAEERLDPEQFFSAQRYLKFMVVSLERHGKLEEIERQSNGIDKLKKLRDFHSDILADVLLSVQVMAQFGKSLGSYNNNNTP